MRKTHYLLITILLLCITNTFAKSNSNMIEIKKELTSESTLTNYVELTSGLKQKFTSESTISNRYKVRTSDREFIAKLEISENGAFELKLYAEKKTWFGWWSYATRYYVSVTHINGEKVNENYSLGLCESGLTFSFYQYNNAYSVEMEVWSQGVGEGRKGTIKCSR